MSGKGWRYRGNAVELRYSVLGKTETATMPAIDGQRPKVKDIEQRLRELRSLADQKRHPTAGRLTTGDWLQRWLMLVASEVSPRTHDQYRMVVRSRIAPALGAVRLGDLDRSAVPAFRADLANTGLKPTSRKEISTILGASLRRAVDDGLIAVNPAAGFKFKRPKSERNVKPNVLDADQCARLIAFAKDDALIYPPVFLALTTGLRRGEVLGLRWRHVDFDAGQIDVVDNISQAPGGACRVTTPKSGIERKVPIAGEVVEELRRIKTQQALGLLKLGVRQTSDTPVCQRGDDGHVLTPNALTEAFRRLIRRSGLPVCKFHDLRHSFASRLISLGVSVRIAAEILGHQDGGALLLRVYVHGDAEQHQTAAERLANALWGKTGQ